MRVVRWRGSVRRGQRETRGVDRRRGDPAGRLQRAGPGAFRSAHDARWRPQHPVRDLEAGLRGWPVLRLGASAVSGPPDVLGEGERRSAAARMAAQRNQNRATRVVIRRAPELMDRLVLLDMLGLLTEEQVEQIQDAVQRDALTP
jgi:hypothetical protein